MLDGETRSPNGGGRESSGERLALSASLMVPLQRALALHASRLSNSGEGWSGEGGTLLKKVSMARDLT